MSGRGGRRRRGRAIYLQALDLGQSVGVEGIQTPLVGASCCAQLDVACDL